MPKRNNNEAAVEPEGKRNNVRLQARHAAVNLLIEAHREEFEQIMVQEAKARGIEYTPELTPEQKAAKQFEELLAANPSLEDQLRHRFGVVDTTETPAAPEPGDAAL